MSWTRNTRIAELDRLTADRILMLDGAMGTMIQRHKLDEAAYRGDRFANYHADVAGNNDLLSLTQPDIIRDIHTAYLAAGSDIVETNTFSSTTIAQADYDMEHLAYELNLKAPSWRAKPAMRWSKPMHRGHAMWRARSARPIAPARFRLMLMTRACVM